MPLTRTSLSKGHLAGTEAIHRFASSGVHSLGSSQGRLNFGSEPVNVAHHRGTRVLLGRLRSGVESEF